MEGKILIVEDSPVVVKIWGINFTRSGQDFISAKKVPDALNILKEQPISGIILDLRLNGPTPNGLEVHTFVRETLQSRIPIVFITGLDPETELNKLASEKVDRDNSVGVFTRLLQKPIPLDKIMEVINDMGSYNSLSQTEIGRAYGFSR